MSPYWPDRRPRAGSARPPSETADDSQAVARAVAEGKCWLPSRCPDRGYCTAFEEGSFKAPCWEEPGG